MKDTTTTPPTPTEAAVDAYRRLTFRNVEAPVTLETLRSWIAEDMGRPGVAPAAGCCSCGEGEPPAALADLAAAAFEVATLLQGGTPKPATLSKARRRLAEGGLPWPNTDADPGEYRAEALEVLARALNDARRPA